MPERTVRIVNKLGLHARAAAQIVKLAGTFVSHISFTRKDTGLSVNGKSILSVLQLAAGQGIEVRIIADGPDATEAVSACEKMFLDGFGELNL